LAILAARPALIATDGNAGLLADMSDESRFSAYCGIPEDAIRDGIVHLSNDRQ